jgi:O-antigen/teichoic acid export membrane protein
MNAILNASAFIFPLITFPYVSRILGPVGTGKVAFATSVISYFSMVAMLGIPTYGIRACARVRDDREKLTKTVQEIFLINFIMSVIVYAVFLISLVTVEKFVQERELLLIMSTTIIFNLIGMEWLYKALEQYSYITMRSLLFKFIALILVFVLIHKPQDYLFYGVTSIFAAAGSNIMNFINARKYVQLKWLKNHNYVQHLKPIAVFFAMSVATTIYTNLDTVMLGFMQGDEQVGYYNAAVKVKTLAVSLVTSIGTVLLPRVSYYIEKRMDTEFKKVTAKAFNLVVLMSLPIVIYFVFYAKEAIVFLSGQDYLPAVVPMQIIMPTIFLIGLTNIMGIQILVPQGREKMVLYSEIVGAIVDLILNVLLIPRYGCAGAAIGTLAAESAVLVVQMYTLKDFIGSVIKEIKSWKIILACIVASIAAAAAHQIPLTNNFIMLVWTAVVFFCVYGAVLLLLKETLLQETVMQIKGKIFHHE